MGRNLVSVDDFSVQDLGNIFELSRQLKTDPDKYRTALQGQMFGLIFEKPSTRTWISFEVGLFSLGGGTIYLGPEDMKLGQREEVRDVARVLARYLAGIVLRTKAHVTITEFKKYFTKPVINGLSDAEHPCQALSDFFTLQEKFGGVKKPVIAFIGDGNNVLNSLILLTAKLGSAIRYATPKGMEPPKGILERARQLAAESGAKIEGFHDAAQAVQGADVVYTDVWVSMGQEKSRDQKIKAFKGFQINRELLKRANPQAKVMHCLPARRGEEITDDVLEGPNSIVFDQAENRLHVQKAILLYLCQTS